MSEQYLVIFSPHALQWLTEITDYLLEQSGSVAVVQQLIDKLHSYLSLVLGQFPESGTPMPELGENMRRVVYQSYSIIYRLQGDAIQIMSLYRENRPW